MSADNWRQCPKCLAKRAEEIESERERVGHSYGRVNAEHYAANRQHLAQLETSTVPDDLREDYEIGITEAGKFYATYRGACDKCKFEFNFDHECNAIKGAK